MTQEQKSLPLIDFPESNELLEFMKAGYERYCSERHKNPFYSSVMRLALSVGRRINAGETSVEEITQTIKILNRFGLSNRADNLGKYIGPCGEEENSAILEKLIRSLADKDDGGRAGFEEFKNAVECVYYGFVFTAHPTFTMTRELSRSLAEYAAAKTSGKKELSEETLAMYSDAEKPYNAPTLNEEAEFSLEAIDNLHSSIISLYKAVFKIGREYYPDKWKELSPKICTIATWVGFDLDGRSDINWTATMAARIMLQIRQMESYREQIVSITNEFPDISEKFEETIDIIDRALIPLQDHYKFFDKYNPCEDPDHEKLQRESRDLIASAKTRMTSPDMLIRKIESILEDTGNDDESSERILVILTQLKNFGLSRCEVHFRINAEQLHNAIRKHVELTTHPADPRFRQTYMDRLLSIFRKSKAGNIHFGDILEEEASAARLFMLIQQIIKHVDGYLPVRFLIAEAESSFTVMAALYFANRFGITHKMDVCPLFETERALTRGGIIADHLLAIPEFRSYIRSRGRMCIQTGYSDAGRYIGQTPAAAAVELLKEKMVRLFVTYDMRDASLLLFDTHGESTGRGGHPGNIHSRMQYLAPAHFVKKLREKGISYIQESSFQGGDGYLYFMSKATSRATLTRILEYWLDEPREDEDRFYEDRQSLNEFFAIVKGYQNEIMRSPDYGTLLSAYGTNMMKPGGSRAALRQYDYTKSENRELYAREYRAIPHNSVLGQMGVLVNSFSGIGSAIKSDPAFYNEMLEDSGRFRIMMQLVMRAAGKSHPDTMKAYMDTLDPMMWLMREAHCSDRNRAQKYAAVAEVLENYSPFMKLGHIFRKIYSDYNSFCQYAEDKTVAEKESEDKNLAYLNALRLALIHQIYMLATEVPNYSPQHDIPRDKLLYLIFKLEIPFVDKELRAIFPVNKDDGNNVDYGETSDYSKEEKEIYAVEQAKIFDPMKRMYELIQDVSSAVNHHIGFLG